MRFISIALWVEFLKVRRSKVPLITFLGLMLAPLVGGFFMIILKDPGRARSLGLIGQKAQITAGVADWPTFLGMLAQTIAIGGLIVFGIITIWVFGREFVDQTAKDLLALPISRSSIVSAKFLVIFVWCALLSVMVFVAGLLVGYLVVLPGWSLSVAFQGLERLALTALITIFLVLPFAFAASMGRGYLPPVGFMFLMLFCSQIVAAIGFGAYFPWSVPALYSGIAGTTTGLNSFSFILVVLAGSIGLAGTLFWWQQADQK